MTCEVLNVTMKVVDGKNSDEENCERQMENKSDSGSQECAISGKRADLLHASESKILNDLGSDVGVEA